MRKTVINVKNSIPYSSLWFLKTGDNYTVVTDENKTYTAYKYIINGIISFDTYLDTSKTEKYLGWVSSGYPMFSAVPIKGILHTQDNSITQECILYLQTNGGLYLSVPKELKSTKFSNVAINDQYYVFIS